MNASGNSNHETLNTDIVVIGGGGAGLAGAVAAAEKRAKVIVLEKRHALGGNSAMAGGLFAAESPVQKQRMIDARRDELFRLAMDYAHWKINPRIVRAFVDKSGDTIRWLEEKGVNFSFLPAMYPNQVVRTMHIPRKGGAEVIGVLTKACKDLGIRLIHQSAAKRILISEKGNVTGVLAATEEREFRILARSVIIASGGYGGNKELLKKYYPSFSEDMHNVGLPHTGDGLLMAIEVGAATEGLGTLQLGGPHFLGLRYVNAVAQQPNTIWVNKNGERFTDETVTFDLSLRGNVIDRQPGKISYTLFDEQIKKSMIEEGLISHEGVMALGVQPATKLPELERGLQLEANKGQAKISDSWDEIASWIGAAPQVLKATIDEYNSFCERGHDKIFVKDPKYLVPLRTAPYYTIKCYSSYTDTIGGIKVNHHMQVLNHLDNPISGLYAAGVTVGGWQSDTYCFILSGSTFGFAINSGRIAGENAAKYVLAK